MPRLFLIAAFCLTACTPARDCTAERQRAERAEKQAADLSKENVVLKEDLRKIDEDLLRLKKATDQPTPPN